MVKSNERAISYERFKYYRFVAYLCPPLARHEEEKQNNPQ